MVSGECPSWKAITTESGETPSEPTRNTPLESVSTYFFDEFMRSSKPSFAVARAQQHSFYLSGTVPAIGRAEHLAFAGSGHIVPRVLRRYRLAFAGSRTKE